MVGAVTLFFFPAPLLMKQCYLICTGEAGAGERRRGGCGLWQLVVG